MPEAEMILSPVPPGRQSGLPFRQLLAWRRQCRASAIRRHRALSRDEPEIIAFTDLDAALDRLSSNAGEGA